MLIGFSLTASERRLEKLFQAQMRVPLLYEPYYYLSSEVYPDLFCIPSESPTEIFPMELGLVPETIQDIYDYRINNPDSIFIQSSNLDSTHKKCLILASGFVLPRYDYVLRRKAPYYYHLKNDSLFCLAGIYEEIKPDYYTTAFLINNNFPLVIKSEREFDYLIGNCSESEKVQNFSAQKLNPDIYYKDGDYNRKQSLNKFF